MNSSSHPERWEKLGSEPKLKTRIFNVLGVRYRHAGRDTAREFVVIEPPDWVNVIALTDDGQLVLVRQFRFGIDHFSLELPGGVIEEGEEPLAAGVRELREETGFTGRSARLLGSVHPNPAIQSNRCHFVLVEGATCSHALEWDPDEEIHVSTEPVEAVLARVHRGEITHGLVIDGLFLFERWWRDRRSHT